ncbi:MAG TPA: hypothetical protein VF035_07730 [Longimicrobiales bacterium]
MSKRIVVLALMVFSLSGCREDDGPLGGGTGELFVSSDPEGAVIVLEDEVTGLFTPDTLRNLPPLSLVRMFFDSSGFQYSASERVTVRSGQAATLRRPLTVQCTGAACYSRNSLMQVHGNMTLAMNATGALFLTDGNGQGLVWPNGTNDSYVSNGMPMIGAKLSGNAVALGMYDIAELAGRPAPVVTREGTELQIDQLSWITPLSSSATLRTIRGIEVRQQVLVDETLPDVVIVRLTFRNKTNSPLYQLLDARGADFPEGLTYDDVYLGFALDPDIGSSNDDWSTYDPELDAVIAYDAAFSENGFAGEGQTAPGLVGLRMLEAPSGARVILNAYNTCPPQVSCSSFGDWHAEEADEVRGWGVLSGLSPYQPDDPSQDIGMLVPGPSDVRIIVSAGPYALRPAEEISIVVAIAVARPTAGTFTSGTVVQPGSPQDSNRPIMHIAADLRAKLVAAEALQGRLTN